jgi:hypothetical protein
MKFLSLLAALALCAAGSPLAAQVRTASIGVSATVAEPLRAELPAAVALELRQGRYLDVAAPSALRGAEGYLVDVVVTRAAGEGLATGDASRPQLPSAAPSPAERLQDGGRYRFDLRGSELPDGGAIRVTYVIATDL